MRIPLEASAKTLHDMAVMDGPDYFRFIFAFIFVLSLMGLLGYALRRWGKLGLSVGAGKRLSIIEIRPIDARHRLALVKCDDTEHLLVLSPDHQVVVQSSTQPAKAAS